MANGAIKNNVHLDDQTVSLSLTSAGVTLGLTVPTYGNPPVIVPGNLFPATVSIGVGQEADQIVIARRHITVDLESLALETGVTLTPSNLRKASDGTPVGWIRPGGGCKVRISLLTTYATDALVFDYVATKGLVQDAGVGSITVSPTDYQRGFQSGVINFLPRNRTTGRLIGYPGRNHRKVYCSKSAIRLTKQAIADAAFGGNLASVTASYLRDTPVHASLGGDGTAKYGSILFPLDPDCVGVLWNNIGGSSAAVNSHWLLFERGYSYSGFSPSIQTGRSESFSSRQLIGAYGTGAKPVIVTLFGISNYSHGVVVQDLEFRPPVLGSYSADNSPYTIWDNCVFNGQKLYVNGVGTLVRAPTLHRSKIYDSHPDVPSAGNTTPYWSQKNQRTSGIFWADCCNILFEGNYLDHNGWAEVYAIDTRKEFPYPPEIYSHDFYIQGNNFGVMARWNFATRAGLVGMQVRSGGIVLENFFAGNNSNFFVGGDGDSFPTDGTSLYSGFTGVYGMALRNVVTSAGQHDAMWQNDIVAWQNDLATFGEYNNNETYKARGIGLNARGQSYIDDIVCHVGDGYGPITSLSQFGPLGRATESQKEPFTDSANRPLMYFVNTGVRNWGVGKDEGLDGLNLSLIDAATIEAFASITMGGSTRNAFLQWLRGIEDHITIHDSLMRHFWTPWQRKPATARSVPATCVFSPDERGRTPARMACISLDWDNGTAERDLPGTVEGDDVDLNGWKYVIWDYQTEHRLGLFELSGGGEAMELEIVVLLDPMDGITNDAGDTIRLTYGGTLDLPGFTGTNQLFLLPEGGRFINRGTMTGNVTITAQGWSETLLCYGNGSVYTLPAEQSLTISGPAIVGWDGPSGACTLNLDGTLIVKAAPVMNFDGLERLTIVDPETGDTSTTMGLPFIEGSVIENESGVSARILNAPNTNITTGKLVLADVDGKFADNDNLIGFRTLGNIIRPGPETIGQVAGTPTYLVPHMRRFASGQDGNETSTIAGTVNLSGPLDLDFRGVAVGSHTILTAQVLAGSFSDVDGICDSDKNVTVTVTPGANGTVVAQVTAGGSGVVS
jgi:hypothetical protein